MIQYEGRVSFYNGPRQGVDGKLAGLMRNMMGYTASRFGKGGQCLECLATNIMMHKKYGSRVLIWVPVWDF
jgi:hypothetical protein